MLRIAILSDVSRALNINARCARTAYTYELAAAMLQSARDTGGIAPDVFAQKKSVCPFPFLAIDFEQQTDIPADSLIGFAYQEAVYTQLVLGGAFDGYEMIHCLAPIVTPLTLLASRGIPIVQTITSAATHPAVRLPPLLLGRRIRQVHIGAYRSASAPASTSVQASTSAPASSPAQASIPPCVNLQQWTLSDATTARPAYVCWLGKRGDAAEQSAVQIAAALGMPLLTADDGEPSVMIKEAALVLDLAAVPCDPTLLIRALACGTPVAAWESAEILSLFHRPGLGAFAPPGELDVLMHRIANIMESNDETRPMRREYVMAYFGQRAFAARYREVYKSLLAS